MMKYVCASLLALLFAVLFSLAFNPSLRAAINDYVFALKKVDEATDYGQLKKVEDTCRAMIASYTKDVLAYQQYVASDSAEKRGWAEQAKMRANQTAATYNEYIRKNSFLWRDNIPVDIRDELDYLNDWEAAS